MASKKLQLYSRLLNPDLFKEEDLNHKVIMIAGSVEGIRLIDNIIINSNIY